ncbi:MAG: hypothetical protein CME71_02355 [Halobacteriovorax sp.]|nr:hypothetical protein [Halobacteriovorax sp.]
MKKVFIIALALTALCSAILLSSPYIARENDSRLYARIVNDQADRPLTELIAPKWNGGEHYAETETPYFRDHLFGVFVVPTLLAKLGVPALQATYVCSLFYKTIALIFFFLWLRLYVSDSIAGLIVLGLQLNPQSMNYTLRANHESLLLMFVIMGIWANHSKRYVIALVACIGAYLTKGLPGLILPGIMALETLVIDRKVIAPGLRFVGALSLIALISYGYELWFEAMTGHSFFSKYISTQIMGRSVEGAAEVSKFVVILKGLGYYASRMLSYALPWTIGIFALKKILPSDHKIWKSCLCVMVPYIVFFSLFDRTASRYIYPAFYFTMVIGLLALCRIRRLPTWLKPQHIAVTNLATLVLLFTGSLISNWDNYLEFK